MHQQSNRGNGGLVRASSKLRLSLAVAAVFGGANTCLPAVAAETGSPAPSVQSPSPAPSASSGTDAATASAPSTSEKKAQADTELSTVVVTATKRAKAAQEIPGSIGVVQGSDLEKMGAQDMESYIKLVPGVSLNKGDQGADMPSIRGITTNAAPGNTGATTGVYIGDVPFTDPYLQGGTIDLNPYDLERIEVLKGPQGTLYGSSSLAGAIRYVPQRPLLDQWEGKLDLSGTALDGNGSIGPMAAGALNVPLGTTSAIRVAGVSQKFPGYIDNNTISDAKNVNSSKESQGRVQWLWAPTKRLSFDAMYLRQESNQADASFADQRQSLSRTDTPSASPSSIAFNIENFSGHYAFDWGTLSSSSSWVSKDYFTDGDVVRDLASELGPLASAARLNEPNHFRTNGFSEELKLSSPDGNTGPWDWMAGAWYQRRAQLATQLLPLPSFELGSGLTTLDPGTLLGAPALNTALKALGLNPLEVPLTQVQAESVGKEVALFGDLTRRFGSHWELTLGGRLFRTSLDANTTGNGVLDLAETGNYSVSQAYGQSSKGFNPKVSLRYAFDRHNSIYALASKGFQFGGVQLIPPGATTTVGGAPIPLTYKSSTLWNYELGAKTEWLQHRLGVDAALFYDRWSNLQIEQIAQGGVYNYIDNVGRAHTEGAELSVRARLLSTVTFSSSLSYIYAVTDVPFNSVGSVIPDGTRLPSTPRFQIASVLAYDQPIADWVAGGALTHTFTGHSFNDLNGTTELGDYATFDARVHLRLQGESFEPDLSLGVNNIFDVKGVAGAFSSPSLSFQDVYFVRPRAVVLTLSMRYL